MRFLGVLRDILSSITDLNIKFLWEPDWMLNLNLQLNFSLFMILVVCVAKQCQGVTVKQFMNIKGNNIILAQWLGKYPCVCADESE